MMLTHDGQEAYFPDVFRVHSLEYAKSIILRQSECSSEDRWARETPWVVDQILKRHQLNSQSVVLDYGCGIGRIAKELIAATRCTVIGVDISPTMRSFADYYVYSDRFFVCDPDALRLMPGVADLVLSVWVLQHVMSPVVELQRITQSMKKSARLFLINETGRSLPVRVGDNFSFKDDQLDIRAMLRDAQFRELETWQIPASVCTEIVASASFGALYQLNL